MKERLSVIVTILLTTLLTLTSVAAQQPNASQRSYQQARRVLDDSYRSTWRSRSFTRDQRLHSQREGQASRTLSKPFR